VKRTPTVVLTQELINKSLQLKNFNKAAKIWKKDRNWNPTLCEQGSKHSL